MLKLRVKQANMSQRYNDNTKRPMPKKKQPGILKLYTFCWNIQQRASGPEENTKSSIFPLKVAPTLLSGSRKGAVGT